MTLAWDCNSNGGRGDIIEINSWIEIFNYVSVHSRD